MSGFPNVCGCPLYGCCEGKEDEEVTKNRRRILTQNEREAEQRSAFKPQGNRICLTQATFDKNEGNSYEPEGNVCGCAYILSDFELVPIASNLGVKTSYHNNVIYGIRKRTTSL